MPAYYREVSGVIERCTIGNAFAFVLWTVVVRWNGWEALGGASGRWTHGKRSKAAGERNGEVSKNAVRATGSATARLPTARST
jgi:hypothetical protein